MHLPEIKLKVNQSQRIALDYAGSNRKAHELSASNDSLSINRLSRWSWGETRLQRRRDGHTLLSSSSSSSVITSGYFTSAREWSRDFLAEFLCLCLAVARRFYIARRYFSPRSNHTMGRANTLREAQRLSPAFAGRKTGELRSRGLSKRFAAYVIKLYSALLHTFTRPLASHFRVPSPSPSRRYDRPRSQEEWLWWLVTSNQTRGGHRLLRARVTWTRTRKLSRRFIRGLPWKRKIAAARPPRARNAIYSNTRTWLSVKPVWSTISLLLRLRRDRYIVDLKGYIVIVR